MKIFATLALSLFSAAAIAMPSIGDTSMFNGNIQGSGGGRMDFTQSLQLTAYDANTERFTLHTELKTSSQTRVQDQQIAAEEFLTTEQVTDALANCPSYGGTSETLTVPAGTFASCKIIQNDGSQVWVAQVPFGIAKQVSYDEDKNMMTLELASFVFGQ